MPTEALRKFFVPKPPSGLEDFASRLDRGINGYLTTQNHHDIVRRMYEAAGVAAEKTRKEGEILYQEELEQGKAKVMAKAMSTLRVFNVEDKLEYIKDKIWRRRGEIVPIEPEISDISGGLKLVCEYPFFKFSHRVTGWNEIPTDEWRYDPIKGETSISVVSRTQGIEKLIVNSKYEYGDRRGGTYVKALHFFTNTGNLLSVDILVAAPESKSLLDSVLIQESGRRIAEELLPSQLEKRAKGILLEVERKPSWKEWTGNRNDL